MNMLEMDIDPRMKIFNYIGVITIVKEGGYRIFSYEQRLEKNIDLN